MYLFIDTSDVEELVVALVNDRCDFLAEKRVGAKYKHSEKLLSEIRKLGNWEIRKIKLEGIIVVKGPGSFTALRIGVATANALAFGMGVRVVGVKRKKEIKGIREFGNSGIRNKDDAVCEEVCLVKKGIKLLKKARLGKWVVPEYGREPNITIRNK